MSLALNPSLYDGLGVSQNDVRPRPTNYSTSTHFSLSFVLQSVACKFPRGVGSTKPSIVHGPLVRPSSDGSFDCLNLSHQKPLVSSSSGRSLAPTVGSMERRARRGGGLPPSLRGGGVRRRYAGRATRRQWKRHKKSDGLRRDEHRLEQFELPEIGDYSPAVVFPVSRCSLLPSI